MTNDVVLNTYVTFNSVVETNVKSGVITIKLGKSDIKEIVINLRKENADFKATIQQCNKSILDLSDIILSLSLNNN